MITQSPEKLLFHLFYNSRSLTEENENIIYTDRKHLSLVYKLNLYQRCGAELRRTYCIN